MGYLNEFEQQQILTLYGRPAQYRCDAPFCKMPIWIDELPVIDKNAGFKRLKKRRDTPAFIDKREPRKTYHIACDRVLREKRPLYTDTNVIQNTYDKLGPGKITKESKKLASRIEKVKTKILDAIKRKPKKDYWSKKKIYRKLFPDVGRTQREPIKKAIQSMLAQGLLERQGHCYVLGRHPKGKI